MIIGCKYMTKIMSEKRANSFCKCVAANSRFKNATVSEKKGGFFVVYEPASEARKAFLLQKQRDARKERAAEQKRNYSLSFVGYAWMILKNGAKAGYEVSEYGCSCPDFQNRGKEQGFACKHMIILQNHLKGETKNETV